MHRQGITRQLLAAAIATALMLGTAQAQDTTQNSAPAAAQQNPAPPAPLPPAPDRKSVV